MTKGTVMLRKVCWIGLALTLLGSAGGITAALASSDITQPETIVLTSMTVKQVGIDVGAKGFGPGDQYVFQDTLYDETGATKVGADRGQCTQSFHAWTVCEVALSIAGRGEITSVGAFNQKEQAADFPLIGGTGEFDNVRGSAHVEFTSEVESTITLNLLP